MKIIRYGNYNDIDVEFLDKFHYIVKNNAYSNFRSGCIKNPYDKTLFNKGYYGVGEYKSRIDNVITEEYSEWSAIMKRCYFDKKDHQHIMENVLFVMNGLTIKILQNGLIRINIL